MLTSPTGVVIGATDVDALVSFLGLLDLVECGREPITSPVPWYDGAPAVSVELAAGDRPRGRVRVVGPLAPATRPAADRQSPGPIAVDVYTRDIAQSLDRLAGKGFRAGPMGHVELGPLVMEQCYVIGPDDVPVVLIEANHRRSSVLDDEPERLHSEVHSMVWVVPSIDEALPALTRTGLQVPFDMPIAHPEVARFMELGDPEARIRMAMLAGPEVEPMRFELFEHLGSAPAPAEGRRGGRIARGAGVIGPWFDVPSPADVAAARVALPEVRWSVLRESATGASMAGVAPGGVFLEVRSGS